MAPRARRSFRVRRARRVAHAPHWHRARRYASVAFCIYLAVLCAGVLEIVAQRYTASRYHLTGSEQSLLGGAVSPALAEKLSFDTAQQAYQFNAGYQPAAQALSVGGAPYTATLPLQIKSGVSLTDPASKLTITLKPDFASLPAQAGSGRLIYPIDAADATMVYSVKNNGLKEDIIVPQYEGDALNFAYTLDLPDGTEARLRPDGSIGIYSGDPALFGNVSTGSARDQALLEKARSNSDKTNLVFVLPAPTITQLHGNTPARAAFSLHGNTLTVQVIGLQGATYPLSIDPSLALANTSDWSAGTDEGGNINFSVSGQISRAGLTGGSVGSWAGGTNTSVGGINFITNNYAFTCNAGSCFSYPIGTDGAGYYSSSGNKRVNNPTYATQIDDWTGYNGYAYSIGGLNKTVNNAPCGGALQPACTYNYNSLSNVQYAKVNSDGTLGTWTSTSSLALAHFEGGVEVYDGYMYVFDAYSPGTSNAMTTQYAKINADGTLGTWQQSTTLSLAAFQANGTAVYDGYFYAYGGQAGGISQTGVYYTRISAAGFGTWQSTTSMAVPADSFASLAYHGYLYAAGGCNSPSGSNCTNPNIIGSVQYAPIYANGSVGAWKTTASISESGNGREAGQLHAYNGYLYVNGGFYCNGSGGSCGTNNANLVYYSDFEYAKIDPAGMLQPFSTATSMGSAAMWDATASGYGYLYSVGGCNGSTATSSACAPAGNAVSAVRVGTIGTDGSLSWTTTTSLPAARWMAQATVYNGYLYVAGGCTSGTLGGCTDQSSILYAPITLSTGQIGSWSTATATLNSTADQVFGFTGYGNALYVAGGHMSGNATLSTEVDYFPLSQGTGNLTTRTQTTSFSGSLNVVAFGYGSRLYLITNTGVYMNTIAANGSLGASWTLAASFTQSGAADTVYKGVIYISNNVHNWYATINADGTVNAKVSLPDNTIARQYHGLAIYNDRMYNYGGCTNTSNFSPGAESCAASNVAVETAAINNGGPGTPGTWGSEANTFTTGREGQSSVVYNGYLYVLGGYDGTNYHNDVQYAQINSDGTLGTWNPTTLPSFTTARAYAGATVYNGYMYIAGGLTTGSLPLSDLQYAQIGSNGTFAADSGCGSSWCQDAGLPQPISQFSLVASNGYLYAVGGATVVSQTFSYTGGSQTFTVPAAVTQVIIQAWGAQGGRARAGVRGGYGGYAQGSITTTPGENLSVFVGGQGASSTTASGASGGYNGGGDGGSSSGIYHGSGGGGGASDVRQSGSALSNRVVVAGGGGGSAYSSATGAGGGTGGGTSGGSGGWDGTSNACGGLGGTQTGGGAAGSCPSGAAGTNGSLGNGGAGASEPLVGESGGGGGGGYYGGGGGGGSGSTANGGGGGGSGHVPSSDSSAYMVNNVNNGNGKVVISYVSSASFSNAVQSVSLNSDGSLGGSWSDANNGGSSFANPRAFPSAVIYGDYLYIMGGNDASNTYNDVQFAPLAGGGLLGGWNYTTPFFKARTGQTAAVSNGYLYIVGGKNGSTYFNDIQYAPLMAGGQLGRWATASTSWTARTYASSAVYNGYLFAMGGNDGTATRRSDIQYASLQSVPRVSSYSKVFTTDKNTMPADYFVTDALQAGNSGITVGYETATSASPAWTSLNSVSPASGTKYPVTISGDGVNYYWIYITIDDSQSASFGVETPTAVSYFQLNYHPNPSMRLRGGKTFNQNKLQGLDAP